MTITVLILNIWILKYIDPEKNAEPKLQSYCRKSHFSFDCNSLINVYNIIYSQNKDKEIMKLLCVIDINKQFIIILLNFLIY